MLNILYEMYSIEIDMSVMYKVKFDKIKQNKDYEVNQRSLSKYSQYYA